MAAAALVLVCGFLALAFVARPIAQWRATGDSGIRGISGTPATVDWWGGVLLVAGVVATPVGAVCAMLGVTVVATGARPVLQWTGLGLAVAGMALTVVAQRQMGASWRIGVDADERTTLVTDGLFGWMRNPVFTAMVVAGLGFALMTASWVSWLAVGLTWIGLEVQVRQVEEPALVRLHGGTYTSYAALVGRFLPGIGRLS